MRTAMDRTRHTRRMLCALTAGLLATLGGCQSLSEGMPANMPIAGHKFSQVKTGMTYAEFEKAFGDGWLSPSSGTDSKYWFFDDGRTLAVAADIWKVPTTKLTYRIIGIAPVAPKTEIPILQSHDTITVTTRGTN